MTKTTELRTELVRRLELLRSESGYTSNIRAVLNPVDVRDKSNHPAQGNYCVLWTEPGELEDERAGRIKWRQVFALDMPVPWSATAEDDLDQIRLELASALAGSLRSHQVITQILGGLVTLYPKNGQHHAVVSAELTLIYVETLDTINK